MDIWRTLNLILDAIATFHLTYATAKMFNAVIPREILPIDSAYGGKFKYLTFWNAGIETLYFMYAVLENCVFIYFGKESEPLLREIRDYWFLSLVLPLSAFVSITFWMLYALDRELVLPRAADPYFPSWLNHSVHTFISIYSFLELLTTHHKATELLWSCCGLWILTIIYIHWCIFVWYKCDMWVYPVLEKLNWPGRIIFFLSCLLMATLCLYAGYHLNNFLPDEHIQAVINILNFRIQRKKGEHQDKIYEPSTQYYIEQRIRCLYDSQT